MRTIILRLTILAMLASPTFAAIVDINLSTAVSGTTVTGVGGSFAQTFAGQTVNGIAIVGSPTNPLILAPAQSLDVGFNDPGVSPASNSIINLANLTSPLSLLLGSDALSLAFTTGAMNGGA